MPDLTIRMMREDDLAGADELRRFVGWNQTPEDWARLLRLEPDGCFVAISDGVIIGTVTTTTYGRTLAWIGMMLVHPDYRRRGIGRRLMQQAVQSLRHKNLRCIKLDATPAGFPLYQQLGFVSEWTLTRFERPAGERVVPTDAAPANTNTRPLVEADWGAVAAIDAGAFGAPRLALLHGLAIDSRRALVWPAEGAVLGWGLLRPGASADYLGPVVCSSNEGSTALVTALLDAAGDRSVFWDVPDQNAAAQATVRQFSFTPLRPLTRMRLGSETVANDPQAQFAIADPAVG